VMGLINTALTNKAAKTSGYGNTLLFG
jgi:hypothetical protein